MWFFDQIGPQLKVWLGQYNIAEEMRHSQESFEKVKQILHGKYVSRAGANFYVINLKLFR